MRYFLVKQSCAVLLSAALITPAFAVAPAEMKQAAAALDQDRHGSLLSLDGMILENVGGPHRCGPPRRPHARRYFPPGVIQFQQDWILAPVNQLLTGGTLLVNDPSSQYGVGLVYFLAWALLVGVQLTRSAPVAA